VKKIGKCNRKPAVFGPELALGVETNRSKYGAKISETGVEKQKRKKKKGRETESRLR